MEQIFLYHALSSGVSGQITLPLQHVIEVQAPSAVPSSGGYSESRVEGFRYEDIISFSSAHTLTTGNETANSYNTLATATIEGLNIHNVVVADRVVARQASRYSKDKKEQSTTIVGTHFENLRVAGCSVKVEIDLKRVESSQRPERAEFGTFAAPLDLKDCRELELLEDGAIHIPQFGKVYLAEILVTPCYQSISMIRVVLGCAVEGQVTVAHASTNGEPMPGRGKP